MQVIVLVLQSMGEFVRQDRFLLFQRNRVYHRNRLGFIVVIAGNFLAVHFGQEFSKIEIARQQSELFHAEFRDGKTFRVVFTGHSCA